MKLNELKGELVRKTVQPLYVFTGEELAIMGVYIKKIVSTANSVCKRVDSVRSIFSKLQNNSFITKPTCYVIRDDKEYLTQEKVWADMNSGKHLGNNIIILVYTNIDKRSKFYKQHSEQIVEFEKLTPDILVKYVKKEIALKDDTAALLVDLCDNNYSRILLECDKIKHLATVRKCDCEMAFRYAINEKVIYKSPKDVIFNFVDAVCQRQVQSCYPLLNELIAINESPLAMISLLYNNFRAMLLVQSAKGQPEISKVTGLTPWQVKLAKEKGNHYSVAELVEAIKVIRNAEKGVKTGGIEQNMAVDYILIHLL